MKLGQEFKFNGKKYAFKGYNKSGNITMRDGITKNNYSLPSHIRESQLEVLETINQNVIDEQQEERNNKMKALRNISTMRENQYFIGEDNKKYIFVKENKTRFEFRNEEGSFTNVFSFLKEPLQEFAKELEIINIYTLKEGQVFIDSKNKKYVFIKANRTKLEFYDYENPKMQYKASPQFIKELLDEIKVIMITMTLYKETKEMEYNKCKKLLLDCMANSEGNEQRRYTQCYTQLMDGKVIISDDIDY